MRDFSFLKIVLWILAIVLLVCTARAGEIGIYACSPLDPDITHLRVYRDGALFASVPIGLLENHPEDVICDLPGYVEHIKKGTLMPHGDDCTLGTYSARYAVEVQPGVFEESSDVLMPPTVARPTVNFVQASAVGITQIVGENFTDEVQVTTGAGEEIPTTRLSCQVLEIPDTPSRVIIVDTGVLPFTYSFPVAAPDGLSVY